MKLISSFGLKERRVEIIALLGVILLAFALRVYRLGHQEFWFDEAATSFIASRSLAGVLEYVRGAPFEHPPLYYILLRLWLWGAGETGFAYRFLSAFFGVLLIPLTYRLGKALFGKRVGLLAGALAAWSPFLVDQSQEARMYTLLACLGVISVWCFWRILHGGGWWHWAIFILATLGALGTHYYGLLLLAFENAFFLVALCRGRRWELARRWYAVQLAMVVVPALYILAAPGLGRTLSDVLGRPLAMGRTWGEVIKFWSDMTLGAVPGAAAIRAISMVFLALVGLGVFAAWRWRMSEEDESPAWLFVALYLLVPVMAALLLPHMFLARYLIIMAPAYFLGLALGLVTLGKRWWVLQALGLTFVVGLSACSLKAYYHDEGKSQYGTMIEELKARERDGDAIILDSPWQSILFQHYYDGDSSVYPLPNQLPPGDDPPPLTPEEAGHVLYTLRGLYPRLWLLLADTEISDPENLAERWLARNAYPAFKRWYTNNTRLYYAFSPLENPDWIRGGGPASFAGRVELVESRVSGRGVAPRDAVLVRLRWRSLVPIEDRLSVVLRLRDADGVEWAKDAWEPQGGWRPTFTWQPGDEVEDRRALIVPLGTPSGDYTVEVELFSSQDGKGLDVLDERGAPAGTSLALGSVRVVSSQEPVPDVALPRERMESVLFGGRIDLLSYELDGGTEVSQGDRLPLTLLWRVREAPEADFRLVLSLVGENGEAGSETFLPLSKVDYPTGRWRAGEVVMGRLTYQVPLDVPAGAYGLFLGVEDVATGRRLVGVGSRWEAAWWVLGGEKVAFETEALPLAELTVREADRVFSVPEISTPMHVEMGDAITFLGYDMAETLVGSEDLWELTLYWRCESAMTTDYKVFTHVLDGDERVWGQKDSMPDEGRHPTSGWAPGEVISDHYNIPMEPGTPPGAYLVEVGMYDPVTAIRLPAFDEDGRRLKDDRILLEEVLVVP